jgi:ferrous iron transport protein B
MHCHTPNQAVHFNHGNSIALVGHPNVGKSALFQRLTGQRVIVANYPGTTVEISRGAVRALPELTLVDTPGVITFPPQTEDEQVTERVLLREPLRAVLQVGDAKNLRRTLGLTVLLAEMGLPLVLALNMMDEADHRGVVVDNDLLSRELDMPVIPTTAVRGRGIDALTRALQSERSPQFQLEYTPEVETAVAYVCSHLQETPIAPRALALLWLSGDPVSETWLHEHLSEGCFQALSEHRAGLLVSDCSEESIAGQILNVRFSYAEQLASKAVLQSGANWQGLTTKLGHLSIHPFWGLIVLAIVLYGLYWFVGVFGAGTLVGLLEENLFANTVNPWVTGWVNRFVPIPILAEFLVGEYGLWTMAVTYALALIMPIVTTFFLSFGILEDSGYLPRLAALSNRLFSTMGLNGKAVLPMVLGLGCVTMAALTTRILESKRDRLLVTLLLALAVPCSAQLGVVMGMLAGISLTATMVWSGVVLLILLVIGWLAARLVPGERSQLLVELPPLRLPVVSNVVMKTLARLEWYLKEVVPLFILGTALLFGLDKTGVLSWVIRAGEPLVSGWLGLPAEASAAFLVGFLRRDFGATGLFMLEAQGLLNPLQVVVSMVTITLFIPCIASIMMIAKERGWRATVGMVVFIFPLAFLVGGLLNRALLAIGWGV